jgi:phospholipase C
MMLNRIKSSAAPRKMLALLTALMTALRPSVTPTYAASKTKHHLLHPASTPIQHLVVIFQENFSFDHYFGTYPMALNPVGEPQFRATQNTPNVMA